VQKQDLGTPQGFAESTEAIPLLREIVREPALTRSKVVSKKPVKYDAAIVGGLFAEKMFQSIIERTGGIEAAAIRRFGQALGPGTEFFPIGRCWDRRAV
jgi:hypothetical protein